MMGNAVCNTMSNLVCMRANSGGLPLALVIPGVSLLASYCQIIRTNNPKMSFLESSHPPLEISTKITI